MGIPRLCPHRPLPAEPYRLGSAAARTCFELDPEPPAAADWARCEAFRFGLDLLNHGFPHEAHEVWEPLWLRLRGPRPVEAHLLQGQIQLAAAELLRRDGRDRGARRVAARALEHLALGSAAAPLWPVATQELADRARALLRAEAGELLPAPPLLLRHPAPGP
jgi:hypothetical protein